MRIVIAGGHGKIALRLERLLAERGDTPVGLIRNPDHADDLRAVGAEPVLIDLETATVTELTEKVMGADAVVFAAGAGPGSGVPRKDTVDRAAAGLLADAASLAGVRRYLMVSAISVDDGPAPDAEPVWAAYVRAKKAADDDLRERSLTADWTILRPGRLTDEPGTGRVWLAPKAEHGDVSREDVAAVLVALLDSPATIGHVLELVGGNTPIAEAVASIGG
ncbi:nucleoside-diphosphate-sugar epimerase [Spinactinospora alkalitolerans]|uniref:Nucleoside-diphosphate-sugar epimerase n=1 Tax=Spinactinospora alkalitolerans TaxID=687207 RepID=A0A852TZ86_9ACTN|nr:SDR family oxidoreductase [Spinactinospora alkalitolerans]NYE49886.1 nucleoside-diphosphate-sugar epimerase [Spinactinospora alkalitolerans]